MMVTGLEVPWALVFLPAQSGQLDNDALVTERPGRVRLIQNWNLISQPVLTLNVVESPGTERGLLGMALDPAFAENSLFYVYYTVSENGQDVNRIERYVLSADHKSAKLDRIVLDGVPSGSIHDGGRLKFGPDGKLYLGTGDPTNYALAQDPKSLAGKILRLNSDGSTPSDNPIAGNPLYLLGVRNVEAFDWIGGGVMAIAEHGPTGELGESGHDRVELTAGGDNFGWPTVYGCESGNGFATPALSWNEAVPPGGGAYYTGNRIPEWTGSFLFGALEATHLHRVVFQTNPYGVVSHEVYFQGDYGQGGGYGRLRDVVQGPDGYLYVTTSNCDGRGTCPSVQDVILRIAHN